MSFLHKFLSEDMANKTLLLCKVDCIQEVKDSGSCSSTCLTFCPSICEFVGVSGLSPPPVTHHKDLKKLLIIGASSIITSLFLVSLLVFCFKYYRSRRRSITISRRWSMERGIDEASPAIIDHPIWHIRTIGLNPSIINSIKVCRYSKEDGLVEGTDCSVCLSEFQEEETLRMLPKCKHAFHLSCIDTWLRSHTNCPLCRAPIVVSEALPPSEEISIGIDENEDGETEEERDEFVSESGRDGEVDEEEAQRVRRTMSLDSLSVIRVRREKEKPRSKQGASNVGSSIVGRSGFLKRSISSSQ